MTELAQHGPLVIDTRRLARRPGTMAEDTLEVTAPARLGTDVIGVAEGTPVRIDMRLESVMEGVLVSGTVEARATGACVRCLDELDWEVDVPFQELFAYADRAAHLEQVGDDDEDQRVIEADQINLEPLIVDAVVLSLPFQPVCSDDCPGLCPECGVRLAGDPSHAHDTIDPRWAALGALRTAEDAGSAEVEQNTQEKRN